MNILYISHVREGYTGWATAATAHMLALESAGANVISRSVKLTNNNFLSNPKIEEFEKKKDKPDFIIQHLLPHHLEFSAIARKNVAYYVQDTMKTPLLWLRKLKLMDDVWCPNLENVKAFNGKVISHPVNPEKYLKDYQQIESPAFNGTKIFYAIVDFNSRKNIEALLSAFYITFHKNEGVSLVIKCSKFNTTPDETKKILHQIDENVKNNLKLYKVLESYQTPVFITEKLTEEQIMSIHKRCDVYVDTSHGEAWCLPMFDAYAMGKTIVTSDYHKKILPYLLQDDDRIYSYETYLDNCIGYVDTFFEVGNAHDMWRNPIINSLSTKMRCAAHATNSRTSRDISSFSYENVGKEMIRALYE